MQLFLKKQNDKIKCKLSKSWSKWTGLDSAEGILQNQRMQDFSNDFAWTLEYQQNVCVQSILHGYIAVIELVRSRLDLGGAAK